ncbi:MAG: RDD family protein [Oscillospiraceae bacterium]|nr:RDD family protein [Oscillospiraceae bacterium]
MSDFFKAPPIKRFAAYLIDLVLLVAITAGVAVGMFSVMNYNGYMEDLNAHFEKYEQKYGTDLDGMTQEMYQSLSQSERDNYDKAYEEMDNDDAARFTLNMVVFIRIVALGVGFLVGYVILEVILPLIFGNGQSLGKKILGLCVMHKHHVRISVWQVIFRAILGKFFVGTLIPMALLMLPNFSIWIISGSTIVAVIAMTQAFIVMFSQANCGIHDKLFNTVVADFNQQYIFDSVEERRAYDRELQRREEAYGTE